MKLFRFGVNDDLAIPKGPNQKTDWEVELGLKPQQFLKACDVVEWGIDGLDSAKQTAIQG